MDKSASDGSTVTAASRGRDPDAHTCSSLALGWSRQTIADKLDHERISVGRLGRTRAQPDRPTGIHDRWRLRSRHSRGHAAEVSVRRRRKVNTSSDSTSLTADGSPAPTKATSPSRKGAARWWRAAVRRALLEFVEFVPFAARRSQTLHLVSKPGDETALGRPTWLRPDHGAVRPQFRCCAGPGREGGRCSRRVVRRSPGGRLEMTSQLRSRGPRQR
jgi:hypothetical protein